MLRPVICDPLPQRQPLWTDSWHTSFHVSNQHFFSLRLYLLNPTMEDAPIYPFTQPHISHRLSIIIFLRKFSVYIIWWFVLLRAKPCLHFLFWITVFHFAGLLRYNRHITKCTYLNVQFNESWPMYTSLKQSLKSRQQASPSPPKLPGDS